MKKNLLLSLLISLSVGYGFAASHTVTNVGTTFSPDTLIIEVGEDVHFDLGSSHNAVEVTEATWETNEATAKSGGFSVPLGGGEITFNTAGTYYYVCQPHASVGMKGIIVVGSITANPIVTGNIRELNVYPDPASEFFNISYTLNAGSNVNIKLFSAVGAEVGNIYDVFQNPGQYEETYTFNHSLPQGLYFVSMNAGNQLYIRKLIIR